LSEPPSDIDSLVLGGARGIGFAQARRLAKEGRSIGLVGRNPARLDHARRRLLRYGARSVEINVADLAEPRQRAALLDRLKANSKPLVSLFVGGPGPRAGRIDEIDAQDEKRAREVCVSYPADMLAIAPSLMPFGGRLYLLSSSASIEPIEGHHFYLSARYRRELDKLAERHLASLSACSIDLIVLRPRVVLTQMSLAYACSRGARGPAAVRTVLKDRFDVASVPSAESYLRRAISEHEAGRAG